jgi:CHASE3 domain sensor protein
MKTNWLKFLFGLSFLIISYILFLTFNYFFKSKEYNELVDHTFEVRNIISEIRSEMRSEVALQRSFIITKDSSFLIKYQDRIKRMDDRMKHLRANIADNEVQIKNFEKLDSLIKQRNLILEMEVNNSGDIELIKKSIVSNINEAVTTLNQFTLMDEIEAKLLENRYQKQKSGYNNLPIALTLLGIISLALLYFIYTKQKIDIAEKLVTIKNKKMIMDRLVDSNVKLEKFANLASHDMQEPLRKIQMFVDTARIAYEKNNNMDFEKYLSKIEKTSLEAIETVKRILDEAQLKAATGEMAMLRISSLIYEVVAENKLPNNLKIDIDKNQDDFMLLNKEELKILFEKIIIFLSSKAKDSEVIIIEQQQIKAKYESFIRLGFYVRPETSKVKPDLIKAIDGNIKILKDKALKPSEYFKLELFDSILSKHNGYFTSNVSENGNSLFILGFSVL